MTPRDGFASRLQTHLEAGRTPEQAVARALGGRVVHPARPAVDPRRLVAALFHDQRGNSYATIAVNLSISPTTARAWVLAGREAWVGDPDGCRRQLSETYGQAFVDRYAPAHLGNAGPSNGPHAA